MNYLFPFASVSQAQTRRGPPLYWIRKMISGANVFSRFLVITREKFACKDSNLNRANRYPLALCVKRYVIILCARPKIARPSKPISFVRLQKAGKPAFF